MSDSNKTTYLPSEMAEEIDSLRAQYHRNMEDLVAEALTLGVSDASVGDLIRVASVDENGKPTSWNPVSLDDIMPEPLTLGVSDASVGDLIRVASVDENGKPTSWNPVSLDDIMPEPVTKDELIDLGLYEKPSGGIPKTDLASDVQESLEKADSSYGTSTVSDNIVTFDAPAEGLPIKALMVNIEPIQDLHGYDSPWPAGGGTNKLLLSDIDTSNTIQSVTVTWAAEAEELTLNGTNSGHATVIEFQAENGHIKFPDLQVGDTWSFAGNLPIGSVISIIYKTTSNTEAQLWGLGGTDTFIKETRAVPNDFVSFQRLQVSIYSGAIFNNAKCHFAFVSGSTITAWSPYSNICPISGWTSATVTRTGKNLFDKNAEYQNGKYLNADGTTTDYSGFAISGYINASPSTSYVVSGVSGNSPSVCCYDKDKRYLGGYAYGGQSSKSFTTPVGTAFIRLTIILSSIDTLQLELGSTATDYEPYQGNTYPITFPTEAGTVYGGTLDVTNGTLTVEYASYTIDENQDFVDRISAQGRVYFPLSNMQSDYSGLDDERCVCDRLKKKATINNTSQLLGITVGANNAYVYIGGPTNIPGVTDLVSFRTWLASNNITFTYKLATPITYQLTPTQIETLLGTNNIWADAGPVTVEHGNYIGMTLDLVSEKADKVQNATADNFAALDANGNLKDSSYKASDFMALGMANASIGDLVRVASVDANGKPTSWRKAPLCEIKPNLNLLDNWYFVGGGSHQGDGIFPINQRGQGEYTTSSGYYIDRWECRSSGSLTLNSEYITFTGNGLNLEQPLSKGQLLKITGKTVTASMYLSDGELVSGTATWPEIPARSWDYAYMGISSRVLLIAGTSEQQEASLIIQPRIAEGINIKAIKLELGSEQTLAHQENGQWVLNEIPDYGQELVKCQRYYETGLAYYGTSAVDGQMYASMPYKTTKIIQPPVIKGEVYYYDVTNRQWVQLANGNVLFGPIEGSPLYGVSVWANSGQPAGTLYRVLCTASTDSSDA